MTIGAVHPGDRVGGVLIAVAAIRLEVGDNAVFPIVRLDLADRAADLRNLDAYAVLELLAPWPFPLGAGDFDEPAGGQGLLAHRDLRDHRRVETAPRAAKNPIELLPMVFLPHGRASWRERGCHKG